MPDPRVFIIRHGETEWSLNGRHTGTTDLLLTKNGESRVRATGEALVGDDRLIVPRQVAHIYVSPRKRAQRTLELMNLGCHARLPWASENGSAAGSNSTPNPNPNPTSPSKIAASDPQAPVEVTLDIAEWDYGDYEGLTSKQIHDQRAQAGLPRWNIWRDGCPGGESPQQVMHRLDRLIADLRTRFHRRAFAGELAQPDVLVFGHGHILRAFAMRWIGRDLTDGVSLLMEAGGIGTLSYEHHNIDEPAILLGGAFTVSAPA